MKNDEILTVKETAALLKTTRQQVRKMIANEELPAVKVGREWRVLKAGSCYLNEYETMECQLAYLIQTLERDNGLFSRVIAFRSKDTT